MSRREPGKNVEMTHTIPATVHRKKIAEYLAQNPEAAVLAKSKRARFFINPDGSRTISVEADGGKLDPMSMKQ